MISPETRSFITTDGIRLDADVYYPPVYYPHGDYPHGDYPPQDSQDSADRYPVLLMRQPYGRAIASTVVYAHPSWYAQQGYIVVIQDVRGRGSSEGDFRLFEAEIQDGYETVNWAANLPKSNGKVGMYGFSYQGMTQIYAAIGRSPALKTICPSMLAFDLYSDWAYEGDVFCLQSNLGWALQLATETAKLQHNEDAFYALRQASQTLPLTDRIPAYPDCLMALAPDSFYHDWIKRDRADSYWSRLSPANYIDQICDLPMLHIGGWFDPYLRGSLNLYQALCDCAQAPQGLIVGPWAHLPWGRRLGAIDFGPQAVSPCDRLQIQWFDYWLKGQSTLDQSILDSYPQPLATWFEMGSNEWKSADRFSPIQTDRISPLSGSVLSAPFSTLVHDPWRPVPSLGGHAGAPAGRFDRSALDDRNDVLTYTGEPLSQAITIQGQAIATIDVETDARSIDLHVVLSEVFLDGRVLNVIQGVQKSAVEKKADTLHQQRRSQIQVELQPTAHCIPSGHALRMSVSLSNFPAFPVNAGDGKPLFESRSMDHAIVSLTVISGAIDLPTGDGVYQLSLASEDF